MSRRRPAFTLIELLVTLSILVLLASTAWQHLGEDPVRAQYFRAKAELKRLQTRVLSAALSTPGYHFATLEEALGLEEPILDPWGRAYQLTHGSGAGRLVVAALADAQEAGTRAPPAPDCRSGAFHAIQSAGPRDMAIPNLGPGEDLKTMLAIAVALGASHEASLPAEAPRLDSVRVSSNQAVLRVFRIDAVDPGKIVLVMNDVPITGTIGLSPHPGATYPLTLAPGLNVLKVTALYVGPQGSTKVGLQIDGASGGSPTGRLQLITGAEGFWEILAP